jgi:5-formyltetrahydrofolate cyclo-ligase
MTQGAYDIPIPVDTPDLEPQVLLVPLTGFDAAGYRLGYGGGFFDRTVVEMTPRPLLVGVGFELSWVHSIHPQVHDVPMDIVVTEVGVRL